ncbi:hypothetical protein GQ54DRAFT_280303 [Martensiomyces pterosporus]|nr:hypothetical protein GQ54DRAFT_280303 [Martensiomyces pterosporus]
MASYAGGRDIFRPTNTDIPPPGAYDVHSPENPYKKYGFVNQEARFKPKPATDGHPSVNDSSSKPRPQSRSSSRLGSSSSTDGQRAVGSTTMSAIRAEEARMKREIERYRKTLLEQQEEGSRESRKLSDKIREAEAKIKDLLRERTDLKQKLLKRDSELRAKEKERDLLSERLEKQQSATALANPKSEKALREHADAANAMCAKLKSTLDKMRRASDEDRRRMRHLEQKIRRLEQEKDAAEDELKKVGEEDYPHRLGRVEEELRAREEQFREDVRKLKVSLHEARDKAASYMNHLGESAVHNTALENELQLAQEREHDKIAEMNRQLDQAMSQLSATQGRLGDLERLSRQRAGESERTIRAANEHIEELKEEIERLETEREEVQREVQGKIRELTADYQAAKREFASSVKGADDERTKRLADTQARLERATKETVDMKTEISELRGVLLKKEMAWKDAQLRLEGDLHAAASDYEALQKQLADQHAQFDAHLRGMEEKAHKKENSWSTERNNLLEKLDAAHKDGFKLRDALDALRREADQAKADCEADLQRMGKELETLRSEADKRAASWEDERKELASAHSDQVASLKEDYAVLEQLLHDDRFSLETQIQDLQDELAAAQAARDEDAARHGQQLAEITVSLEEQRQISEDLEDQLAEKESGHAAEVQELEEAIEESRLGHEQALAELHDELSSAKERAAEYGAKLRSERQESEMLRQDNDALTARAQELEDAHEVLTRDYDALQEVADELSAGAERAGEELAGSVSHYAGLLGQLHSKQAAEKEKWESERAGMKMLINRYRHREEMHVIREEYLTALLGIKEDARAHMVQEARSLYCELQDQATVAYEHMDTGAELASDLQRLLTLSSTTAAVPTNAGDNRTAPLSVDDLVSEAKAVSRETFLEGVRCSQEAQLSRMRVESEMQELKYMAVQGKIVETVSSMSAQHKEGLARLESDLAEARSDYSDLQELSRVNRTAFETQIAELESEVSELRSKGAPSEALAALQMKNEALEAQIGKLSDENSELDARIELIDYEVDDERAEYERERAAFEAQLKRMHQVLSQCEIDMAAQVDQINSMRQYTAEVEGERAIMAEQSQFQISWLKENYAAAYRDLDAILSNNGGHTNLRQRIKYVESLKTQILTLKRENFDSSRDRDRFKHQVGLLKGELDAYKEVNDVEAFRSRSRVRGRSASRHAKSASRPRQQQGAQADPNGGTQRAALEKRGASVVARALEEARQRGQMRMVDDSSAMAD